MTQAQTRRFWKVFDDDITWQFFLGVASVPKEALCAALITKFHGRYPLGGVPLIECSDKIGVGKIRQFLQLFPLIL